MQNHAPTIYAYPDLAALLDGEASRGRKEKLPGAGGKKVTERGNIPVAGPSNEIV